jgi:hypothetical protein
MDRNRKILISILAMLVFTAIIAIVHISLSIDEQRPGKISLSTPQFGPGVAIVRVEGPIGFSVDRGPSTWSKAARP